MIKFKKNNDEYSVEVFGLKVSLEDGIEYDDVKVLKNGTETTSLGETFYGINYVPGDVLESIISEYLNGNEALFGITGMPDEVSQFRDSLSIETIDVNGRNVPKTYYTCGCCEIVAIPLVMLTDKVACYADTSSEKFAMTSTTDGAFLTDVEEFWCNGAFDSYRDDKKIFITPEMENWLKDWQENE